MDLQACYGCGAEVPRIDGPTHRYIGASPGCWAIFGEVGARVGELGLSGAHELMVDAYAVQHPGTASPQAIQSVAVHLLSLYAVFDLGHRREHATALRRRAVRKRGVYRWLDPPSFAGSLTVLHVRDPEDAGTYAARAEDWARSVWLAWASHRPVITRWFEDRVAR